MPPTPAQRSGFAHARGVILGVPRAREAADRRVQRPCRSRRRFPAMGTAEKDALRGMLEGLLRIPGGLLTARRLRCDGCGPVPRAGDPLRDAVAAASATERAAAARPSRGDHADDRTAAGLTQARSSRRGRRIAAAGSRAIGRPGARLPPTKRLRSLLTAGSPVQGGCAGARENAPCSGRLQAGSRAGSRPRSCWTSAASATGVAIPLSRSAPCPPTANPPGSDPHPRSRRRHPPVRLSRRRRRRRCSSAPSVSGVGPRWGSDPVGLPTGGGRPGGGRRRRSAPEIESPCGAQASGEDRAAR